jgi:hypothetical protein
VFGGWRFAVPFGLDIRRRSFADPETIGAATDEFRPGLRSSSLEVRIVPREIANLDLTEGQ